MGTSIRSSGDSEAFGQQADITSLTRALADIASGARAWPLWIELGNHDIRNRFQRSRLGPIWAAAPLAVTAASLGVVYARVLDKSLETYLPYVTAGLIIWNFIAATLQEGCNAFVVEAGVLWQTYIPRSLCLYRVLWRNLIVLGVNCTVFAGAALLVSLHPSWNMLFALPGLALLCANLFWVCMFLALLGTRFRDVSRVVAILLQLGLLVTPILWDAGSDPMLQTVRMINPLYHAIELVRAPLLGTVPEPTTWIAALFVLIAGWGMTIAVFARYRWRITYWL